MQSLTALTGYGFGLWDTIFKTPAISPFKMATAMTAVTPADPR